MHAAPLTAAEQTATHQQHPIELVAPAPDADHMLDAAAELRRWYLLLGVPFLLAALCFIGAIASGQLWLIGATLITGPGLLIMAFIYLGLSSDTNSSH